MRWFGRPSNWEASTDLGDVLAWCEAINRECFPVPLPDLEVRHIAKHVCKISRKNLASGQTQHGLSRSQSWKGKRGGKMSGASRRKRTTGRDVGIIRAVLSGQSMRSVAREYGMDEKNVRHIVGRGAE